MAPLSGGSLISSARISRGSAHTRPTPKRERAPASTGAHCALQTLIPVYTIARPKPAVNYVVRGNLSIPQPERPIEDTQHPIPGLIHRAASQPQTPADLVPGPALAIAQPHKLPVSWRETPEHPTNDCGIRKHLTMLGDP